VAGAGVHGRPPTKDTGRAGTDRDQPVAKTRWRRRSRPTRRSPPFDRPGQRAATSQHLTRRRLSTFRSHLINQLRRPLKRRQWTSSRIQSQTILTQQNETSHQNKITPERTPISIYPDNCFRFELPTTVRCTILNSKLIKFRQCNFNSEL